MNSASPFRQYWSRCSAKELLTLGLCLFVYFLYVALMMPMDIDEGYYAVSAKLVGLGMMPYRDFFYTQMPYMPYIMYPWFALTGYDWYLARVFGAAVATLNGALLYTFAKRRGLSVKFASGFTLFFIASTLVSDWFVVLKTYGLTSFLFLLAFLIIEECRDSESTFRWFVLAGVLAGLCIGIRLPFAASIACLFLRLRKSHLIPFCLGGLIATAPILFFYLAAPDAFVFNNFGFHEVRTGAGLVGATPQKIFSVFAQFGFHRSYAAISFQNILLLVIGALAWSDKKWSWPPALMAAVFVFVGLLPTPTFAQYNCVAIPFLLLAVMPWIESRVKSENGPRQLGALLFLFCLGLPIGLRSSFAYPPYLTVGEGTVLKRLSVLRNVSQQIEAWTEPGDVVYSTWPGYLFETDRKFLPGTENNFPSTLNIFPRLSTEDANRYQIMTDEQLYGAFQRGEVSLVVSGEGLRDQEEGAKRHQILISAGYRVVWTNGSILFYSKRAEPRFRLY